jgi:Domain of unknown function (DUF4386)
VSKLLDRFADLSGVLFVVLVFVGYVVFVAPHMPESLADPEQVADHLRAHPPTAGLWLGMALEGAGLVALTVFATRLAARIRAVDPVSWVPAAVVAIAVAAMTVKLSSFTPGIAALDVDRYDPGTVTALLAINDAAFDVSWALDGAFVLLLGLGTLATRALPRWLAGWATLAGAAILVGIAVPAVFDTFQLIFILWVLVTSGWLLVRGGRRPAPAPGATTAAATAAP